jgi:diguanylate cyclase (GGDEF)-like protein/PAS domain S-box-containing protein
VPGPTSVLIHATNRFLATGWICVLVAALVLWSARPVVAAQAPQAVADESSLQTVRLRLNWHHQFQFAGFYAAQMQGFYRDQGLNVEIQNWNPRDLPSEVLQSQQADFAVGYSTLVGDFARGAPIRLVMSAFQYSPMILLSHEPITDLSEAGGKRVMHQQNMQVMNLVRQIQKLSPQPVVEVPTSGRLEDFIDGNVDLYAAYMTNEPYRLKQQGVPFHVLDPKSYGSQSYGDMVVTSRYFARQHSDRVQAFRDATVRGWQYALDNPEPVVDYIMTHFDVIKSRDALLSEAKLTRQYVQSGNTPIGDVDVAKVKATAASARDAGLITETTYRSVEWEDFMFQPSSLTLTPQEQAFLMHNPVIRIGNDINWEPFEFVDPTGRYQGIAAEYLALFEKRLGVRFEPIKDQAWSEVVSMAKNGEVDMYSCAVGSPERQRYMRFTQPYLSFPMVLVGLKDMSYIQDYNQLNHETVAVVAGYWSEEALQKHYPGIRILKVGSVKEGIEAVVDGRARAYSGNLGAVNYAINQHGLTGVHVIGQSEQRFELAMGVRRDSPILFSIIQKTLHSITEQERQEIFNRWIRLEVVNQLDSKQLWKLAGAAALLAMFLIALAVVYRYQKKRQQAYIDQIHELTYATLIDLETMRVIKASDSFLRLSGYAREDLAGMNYLDLSTDQIESDRQDKILTLLLEGKRWRGEVQGRKKSGQLYWVALTFSPVRDWKGEVAQVWATRVDITDRKKLERLSIEDELTGLYNRRFFNQQFPKELSRHQREKNPVCVAMLDLDYFKEINDYFGHQHGDQVLVQVADLLKIRFSRSGDYIFRMGGEEFMVVTTMPTAEVFYQHCDNLRRAVSDCAIANPEAPQGILTLSIGALFCDPDEAFETDEIYHRVDEQLYLAKDQGRNQVRMV